MVDYKLFVGTGHALSFRTDML